ncbi:MAG TPA: NUDIX domain-containing protein [Bacteroidales bacterium]|nr:NUDIX domain-containing protein [Bacteroidales bacterium]
MYNFFFNNKPIYITHTIPKNIKDNIITCQSNDKEIIEKYFKLFEKDTEKKCMYIIIKDLPKLTTNKILHFNVLKAAGGLVENEAEKYLFIFKNGHWDLPKGHIDNNETKKETAIREVKEETGIKELSINYYITLTRHLFKRNNQYFIKETSWYKMFTPYTKQLIPQLSEGISIVKWISKHQIKKYIYPYTYQTIIEVLEKEQKKQIIV